MQTVSSDEQHVLQVGIGGGMHGNRLDAHLAAGAQNTERDLAAIGDDDFVEHVAPACLFVPALVDDEQRLAILDGFAVLYAYGLDHAGDVRLDLVHHLHRLDDA